jgi:hypothetical protein
MQLSGMSLVAFSFFLAVSSYIQHCLWWISIMVRAGSSLQGGNVGSMFSSSGKLSFMYFHDLYSHTSFSVLAKLDILLHIPCRQVAELNMQLLAGGLWHPTQSGVDLWAGNKLVAVWMRIMLTLLFSYVFLVLAYNMMESSHCFQKCDRDSAHRFCTMLFPKSGSILINLLMSTVGLIRSVGSHGSLSTVFVMKVMVWHFVSDSHKVVTALFSCYI